MGVFDRVSEQISNEARQVPCTEDYFTEFCLKFDEGADRLSFFFQRKLLFLKSVGG